MLLGEREYVCAAKIHQLQNYASELLCRVRGTEDVIDVAPMNKKKHRRKKTMAPSSRSCKKACTAMNGGTLRPYNMIIR